ncbi:hypothetical protein ACVWZB_004832 [Paenibacillus polymyxa]
MELTRDQILSMKAGRDMDRLVEEHVFCWIAWQEQHGVHLMVTFQKPGEPEPYKRFQDWKSQMDRFSIIPFSEIDIMKRAVYGDKNFSTIVSETWKVEQLAIQKFGVSYAYALASVIGGTVIKDTDGLDDFVTRYSGNLLGMLHATPEQRCKAALLAALNL